MSKNKAHVNCAWVHTHLEAYVDQALETNEQVLLETHLAQCSHCTAEWGLAQRIGASLRALPRLEAPGSMADQVLDRVEGGVLPLWRRPSLWAAAAAVLIAVGAVLYQPKVGSPDYSPAQIAQAQEQAKWALAYVSQVGRRSGFTVRDQVFKSRTIGPMSAE